MKFYAFFLPQFHECSFNNEWWGKGFTEWNNVKGANPQIPNHYQPRVPLDGYYDLSDKMTLQNQFDEAKRHGIDGFSIYHYWYKGKRPLGKVVDVLLENQDISGNFSLCWANHSWTKSWKNRKGSLDVLIEQEYETNREEMLAHFNYLKKVFFDKRYIRVDGKPIFQIYSPESIPNLKDFILNLRYFFKHQGVDLHLSGMITSFKYDWEYLDLFDSITFFQPSLALFSKENLFDKSVNLKDKNLTKSLIRALPNWVKKLLFPVQDLLFNKVVIANYDEVWRNLINQYKSSVNSKYKIFPSAFVEFDNTPRYKKRARITVGFTPEKFKKYLIELVEKNKSEILYINAWNEWGEGMYLQADNLYNNERLEAINVVKKILLKKINEENK